MKKALFAVAAVALLAASVQAGEIKTHTWPCTFTPLQITTIPVKMDIGYYVAIENQGDLVINMAQESIHVYSGCTDISVKCNFNVTLSCSIASNGTVPGDYSCSITGAGISSPGGTATVCAKLENADLSKTAGGQTGVKVASVTISVVPTS